VFYLLLKGSTGVGWAQGLGVRRSNVKSPTKKSKHVKSRVFAEII